jgi:hypothetical protein
MYICRVRLNESSGVKILLRCAEGGADDTLHHFLPNGKVEGEGEGGNVGGRGKGGEGEGEGKGRASG